MRGVSAVAEVLKREGAEYLFVFPQQALIEECARIGIKPILCRQERVGMGIADGFSRTSNGKRLGVFAMQQGPGAGGGPVAGARPRRSRGVRCPRPRSSLRGQSWATCH